MTRTPTHHAHNDLYRSDLAAWLDRQSEALRERRLAEIDHERLAAAVATLGRPVLQGVRNHLAVILTGLLRWAYEVDLRSHGWAATIDKQRLALAHLILESPSLASRLDRDIAAVYPAAQQRAVLESGLFEESFPAACPFSANEVQERGWFPDPFGDDAVRGEGWWKRRIA